jgi:hypothetical protein
VQSDTGTLKLVALAPAVPVYRGTWTATHPPKPGQPQRPNLVETIS